jgi:hypothetical protein
VVANQILYANWTPNTYEWVFDTQLGTAESQPTAHYDAACRTRECTVQEWVQLPRLLRSTKRYGNQYYDAEMESTATWDKARTRCYTPSGQPGELRHQGATHQIRTETVVYTAGTERSMRCPHLPTTNYTFGLVDHNGGGPSSPSATEWRKRHCLSQVGVG